jgi:hypothetical protein
VAPVTPNDDADDDEHAEGCGGCGDGDDGHQMMMMLMKWMLCDVRPPLDGDCVYAMPLLHLHWMHQHLLALMVADLLLRQSQKDLVAVTVAVVLVAVEGWW